MTSRKPSSPANTPASPDPAPPGVEVGLEDATPEDDDDADDAAWLAMSFEDRLAALREAGLGLSDEDCVRIARTDPRTGLEEGEEPPSWGPDADGNWPDNRTEEERARDEALFAAMEAGWYAGEPVLWLEAGTEVAEGPLARAGWYAEPHCTVMCCRPDGPFPDEAAARRWCQDLAAAYTSGDAAAKAALVAAAKALRGG